MLPANEKDKGLTNLDIPYAALTTFEQIAIQENEYELPSMLEDLICKHVKFELNCDQCTRFLMVGMAPLDEQEPELKEAAACYAVDEFTAKQSERELNDMLEDLNSDHSEIRTARGQSVMLSARIAHDVHDSELVQPAAAPTMDTFRVKDVDFSQHVVAHGVQKCSGCTTHKLFQRVINQL